MLKHLKNVVGEPTTVLFNRNFLEASLVILREKRIQPLMTLQLG